MCSLVDSHVSRAVVRVVSRAAVLLRERRRVPFAGVARHFLRDNKLFSLINTRGR